MATNRTKPQFTQPARLKIHPLQYVDVSCPFKQHSKHLHPSDCDLSLSLVCFHYFVHICISLSYKLEAASARMAARDRFGSFADPSLSPLQRAIRVSFSVQSTIHFANSLSNRQCLRTDKLRTESRIEPRSRGLDKPEERQCVSGAFHHSTSLERLMIFTTLKLTSFVLIQSPRRCHCDCPFDQFPKPECRSFGFGGAYFVPWPGSRLLYIAL